MRTRPFNVPRRPSVFLSVAALIRMAHHNTVRTCHCQHAGSRYSNDPLIHAVFHRVLSAFPPILDLMVCIPHCRLWNARVHNVAFGDYMWCTNMQQPIRSGPESFKPMISRERPSSSVPLPLCLSWTGSRSIVSMFSPHRDLSLPESKSSFHSSTPLGIIFSSTSRVGRYYMSS